ncbi:hypothetical protein K466DRAFT_664106 [Polyporus arcularius HHB13444]|uniref:Uncharacterized protein n=1 Tax=Polyporus arcularius HHB13444 TaxID=1314778 RepID=A0A5C3P8H0_9APHY|nr:hypothetical protein K466DRAFT_664106 [Polyporus arcularius HHB13444]
MSTTTTTLRKTLKRGSDALSDTNPGILRATTGPRVLTHKKRRLDAGNHPGSDGTTPHLKRCTFISSVASGLHDGRDNKPGSSSSAQSKSIKASLQDRSETLISTRRVGPSVVVRKYEVRVVRPKAKQASSQLSVNTSPTPWLSPTSTSIGTTAAKSPATESERIEEAPAQQSTTKEHHIGTKEPALKQSRKENNAAGSKLAVKKDQPRRVSARALAMASTLSAEKVERLLAKIGMNGYRMPPTMARLPSFRKNKP